MFGLTAAFLASGLPGLPVSLPGGQSGESGSWTAWELAGQGVQGAWELGEMHSWGTWGEAQLGSQLFGCLGAGQHEEPGKPRGKELGSPGRQLRDPWFSFSLL